MCSTEYGQPALAATWWVTRGAKLRVVGGGEATVGGALSESSGGCSVAAGTLPLCGDRAYATELSDTGWRMYVGGCAPYHPCPAGRAAAVVDGEGYSKY
jgi:hypothetical protein